MNYFRSRRRQQQTDTMSRYPCHAHSFSLPDHLIADDCHEQKMILVGGFSSSDALQKRVQEEFPDVEVIQKPM